MKTSNINGVYNRMMKIGENYRTYISRIFEKRGDILISILRCEYVPDYRTMLLLITREEEKDYPLEAECIFKIHTILSLMKQDEADFLWYTFFGINDGQKLITRYSHSGYFRFKKVSSRAFLKYMEENRNGKEEGYLETRIEK